MNTTQTSQSQTPTTPSLQPINTPSFTQTPVQSPTPTTKKPWLLISLVVLLLSVTSVLGYKYYELKQQVDNQPQPPPLFSPQLVVSSPSPVTSPTTEVDPTVGWKTYTNTEYGFSFKHPNLNSECCGLSGPATGTHPVFETFADIDTVMRGTDAPFAGVGVHVITGITSFENYITEEKKALNSQFEAMADPDPNHQGKQTSTTLAGQKGYILKNYSWDNIDRYYVPIPNSGNVLVVSLGRKESSAFTYQQILSTFEFTR